MQRYNTDCSWWRHGMEMLYTLLTHFVGDQSYDYCFPWQRNSKKVIRCFFVVNFINIFKKQWCFLLYGASGRTTWPKSIIDGYMQFVLCCWIWSAEHLNLHNCEQKSGYEKIKRNVTMLCYCKTHRTEIPMVGLPAKSNALMSMRVAVIMTSSNGNIFRVTVPVRGSHRSP